jgi:hypothetical protein
MITLLHGNYSEASRKEYIRLKSEAKGKEIRALDGKTLDPAALTQALESNSLFGGDTIVFIENLFGKLGRKVKLIESLSVILNNSSADIVLWEDKELGVTVLKNLPKAKVTAFKIPSSIFQFLDGIVPDAKMPVLPSEPAELVFAMLVRRVRQLIQIKDTVTPEGMQGWQAARLTRQAKLFTMERLVGLYKTLLDCEYATKNGSAPFTMSQYIEQILVDL